jgi:hypothetical protein
MAVYYTLTSCNVLYPDITPVATNLFSYIGLVITIEDNPYKSYLVSEESGMGVISIDPEKVEVVDGCVPCLGFNSHLTLSSNSCSCGSIVMTDDSVYVNSVEGHDSWGYRRLVLTDSDGNKKVWSSESSENPDYDITPYNGSSPDAFTFTFATTNTDGVYDAKLYTFPNWSDTVTYNSLYGAIVYKGGVLYKIKTTNIGEDPTTDTDGIYWEVYEISEDTLATRYAYQEKIVILCISLLKCKEGLIRDAFCSVATNPCGDMCKNPKFMAAMKFQVTEMAIGISTCAKDWASVEKDIEILKNICRCGGGC